MIGLETAFAAVLSFVHDGTITDTRAVELTSGPARLLGLQGRLGTLSEEALYTLRWSIRNASGR